MSSKLRNRKKTSSLKGKASVKIFVCLLASVAGLAVPLIYYMLSFSPVLTDDMLSEFSFVQYLCANNSHTFASGWTSTREFAPFGVRFFLTFFYTSPGSWQNALSSAVFASYGLFSCSFLFFVYTLRAKHFPTYIICFLSGAFLGHLSLQGTYYCSNLITYLTFAFIVLGLLIQGIRCRINLPLPAAIPIRILISALCAVPVFFLVRYVNTLSVNYSFKTISFSAAEIKKQFSIPLISKPANAADTSDIAGFEKYLEESGTDLMYCDTEITERMYFLSGGEHNTATVTALDNITKVTATDCPENLYDRIEPDTFPLYVAISNINLPEYKDSKITLFSKVCYSDDYFTVLRYDNADYYYDTALQTDIMALENESYNTILLSMFDLSTSDSDEADTYMGWSSLFTSRVFSDLKYWNLYTDIIFEGNNDDIPEDEEDETADEATDNEKTDSDKKKEISVAESNSEEGDSDDENDKKPVPHIQHCLLGVDPEALMHLSGDDKNGMILLIDKTLEKTVAENKYTDFIFIFPGYEASHYSGYTEDDYELLAASYKTFTEIFDGYENVSYNYYGDEEWLYTNSYIFEGDAESALEPEVAYTVLGHILAGHYQADSEELNERILKFTETMADYNSGNIFSYTLSNTSLVIVGDSIFGLFENNSSIQSILANYSGAYVDCRAIGGATASYEEEKGISLTHQFDISDVNAKLEKENAGNNRLVFIIEFGLNDYFEEYPALSTEDPYDRSTYSGALRTTIEAIKANWPGSEIMIISPGYIDGYESGKRKVGDGYVLQDYRNAAIDLSEEYSTMLLDLTQIGITQDNLSEYTIDLLHYNEAGRMLIAREIVNLLRAGGQ